MHAVCLHNLKKALMILMRQDKAVNRVNFVAHFHTKTQIANRRLVIKLHATSLLQNTGLDNGTSAAATWQLLFGARTLRLSFNLDYKFSFSI